MANVLHLHPYPPDYQTRAALEQLTRKRRARSLSIGRGGDFATALIAAVRLRKLAPDYDLIHAWGTTALGIAALSGAGRKLIFNPTRFPTTKDLRWVRAIDSVHTLQIICPTDTVRRRFVERGIPIERCHLVRPGVDFSKIQRRRDDALRARLGFGPDDVVILGAGESIRAANHRAAILATAVLHLYEPKYKFLLWGSGPMLASERKYTAQMLPTAFMSIATDVLGTSVRFEDLLPACDAILITADAPVPPLPIAVCMAAGLPIVAVVTPTVAEMLEDRHSALMIGRVNSRAIAQRILDLGADSRLQWSISDAAKTEAFEYFSMTRFVQQMNGIYDQVAVGRRVEMPLQPAGAGTRFFGRA